jgi:hypothetical protein
MPPSSAVRRFKFAQKTSRFGCSKSPTAKAEYDAQETERRINSIMERRHRAGARARPRLLYCSPADVGEIARGVVETLSAVDPELRRERLAELGHCLRKDWQRADDQAREANRLATLEILVRFQHLSAGHLLVERIAIRPVAESHLYLASLARGPLVLAPMRLRVLARKIAGMLEDAWTEQAAITDTLRRRLSVEAFRALAKICPEAATGNVCRLLPKLCGLEQTAIWDSVAGAAATLGQRARSQTVLATAARETLHTLLACENPDDVDNYPGITARVLEVACRTGDPAITPLDGLNPLGGMRIWVLQQFARRPLEFLDAGTRATVYIETLKALIQKTQLQSFAELVSRIARDYPDGVEQILKRALKP